MNPLRIVERHLLLTRDFVSNLRDAVGSAWSLARMDDCERWGGHYWSAVKDDPQLGKSRQCVHCKTTELLKDPQPVRGYMMYPWSYTMTGTNNDNWSGSTYTIWPTI